MRIATLLCFCQFDCRSFPVRFNFTTSFRQKDMTYLVLRVSRMEIVVDLCNLVLSDLRMRRVDCNPGRQANIWTGREEYTRGVGWISKDHIVKIHLGIVMKGDR
jgi:hypothetical protein